MFFFVSANLIWPQKNFYVRITNTAKILGSFLGVKKNAIFLTPLSIGKESVSRPYLIFPPIKKKAMPLEIKNFAISSTLS
jgi:hypothetical protein